MQTLNVGAGQTDADYKAAAEMRRVDLLAESRSDANYFFWAAGLAALGSGLLPIRLNLVVSVGIIDLMGRYGWAPGPIYSLSLFVAALMWVVVLLALGFAGRGGHRWAFLAGIILYGADMIALTLTFSLWAVGIHAFFVLKWFQGQKALKDLNDPAVSTF